MKYLRLLVLLISVSPSVFAADTPTPAKTSTPDLSPKSLSTTPTLPTDFAGWQLKGDVTKSDDPASADPANAQVLKEYGFQRT